MIYLAADDDAGPKPPAECPLLSQPIQVYAENPHQFTPGRGEDAFLCGGATIGLAATLLYPVFNEYLSPKTDFLSWETIKNQFTPASFAYGATSGFMVNLFTEEDFGGSQTTKNYLALIVYSSIVYPALGPALGF